MPRACLGLEDGTQCAFSQSGDACQPKPGRDRCVWCNDHHLLNSLSSAGGQAQLRQRLCNMPGPSRTLAMQRIPREYRADFSEFNVAVVDPSPMKRPAAAHPSRVLERQLSYHGGAQTPGASAARARPKAEIHKEMIAKRSVIVRPFEW